MLETNYVVLVSKLIYEEGMCVLIMALFGLCLCLLYTFQKRFSFSGAFPLYVCYRYVCIYFAIIEILLSTVSVV